MSGQERNVITGMCELSACPQYYTLNSSTHQCELTSCPPFQLYDPVHKVCHNTPICTPPETDNGFGVCAVKECTGGQILNESTGQCQTPPDSCASTETYNNAKNKCELWALRCPGHSHANTANDQCLDDAPLICPEGQHDDGSYTCISNAEPNHSCPPNTQKVYINGIPQCIHKPHLDTLQKQYADAYAASNADPSSAEKTAMAAQRQREYSDAVMQQIADNTAAVAENSSSNSNSELNTESLSTIATQSSEISSNTATAASKLTDIALTEFDSNNKLTNIVNNTAASDTSLSQISTAITDINNREKANVASPGSSNCNSPPSCSGDAIQCTILQQNYQNECRAFEPVGAPDPIQNKDLTLNSNYNPGSPSGSCPAPSVIATHHGTISMFYQSECDLATSIAPFVIMLGWISAGFIVFSTIKE
jgi:hypothetical protein